MDVTDAPAFLAGEWKASGRWMERTGPYLQQVVSRAVAAEPGHVTAAAGYAKLAAKAVARTTPAGRADVLERAAALAAQRKDQLATLLATELGKPVKDGRGEIDRVADTLKTCADTARQLGGELLPGASYPRGATTTALTYRAPAGVALAITPFNAPANLLAHKLGASFAAGNTTIVKGPPQAPATTAAVVELMLDAGMPPEAVQLLHGGADVGAMLCAAEEVAVISFTGSAAAGAAVARASGTARPKRLVLELGGNAATIVCADADVAAAAANCARTGYTNSGQSCISVQRVYVQQDRFAEFLESFTAEVRALRTGDPLDDSTDVGSMVDEEAAERVVRWAGEAAAEGATIAAGGTRDGATVAPTVVARPRQTARVVTEEVFGALVAVLPFGALGDVIETCNRSRYGLQAGLFTRDIDTIFRVWRDLETGGLVAGGSSNFRLDHLPFGGVKDSGFGRESPRWLIEDFTVVKTLLLRGVSLFGGPA
ncbi:MAG: aldehyde dehydrogenase family protein [Streptosporangiaceae bacterium]|nr:aldehyde dehydrogenase family protein [Streptosporangiaceae bacterium]MBV9855338.1 aldehyde dehydrogenase family protein [Streptosporangiaceae bacterium]